MSVSVIIPFYKAEAYFPEALQSVLAQSSPPSEIIVVNDSPSPTSIEFLSRFADRCVIHTMPQNGGVSAARNTGVALAQSEWIAFLDADDRWEPQKLAHQQQFLRENEDYAGCHTGVSVFHGTETLAQYVSKSSPLNPRDLLTSSQVVPSSFMLRRQTFLDLGGFDQSLVSSEDYDLTIRLVKGKHNIGFIPLPLTQLRRENHSNISGNWKKMLHGHLNLVRKHSDFYLGEGGFNVTRRFIGRSFQSSGYRCGGLQGKLMRITGSLIAIGA